MKKIIVFITFLVLIYFLRKNYIISSTKQSVQINTKTIFVEVADTDAKRNQGLSDRTSLEPDSGMLFLFPKPGLYSFWMYHMNFPLDVVYIYKNKVVDLKENIPAPEKGEENPPVFASSSSSDKVLEINSGKVKVWNIRIGDSVSFNL